MSEDGDYSALSVLGGAVDPAELFADHWMAEHTEYESLEAFLSDTDSAPGEAEPSTGGLQSEWDSHVASSTAFDDWAAMVASALDDYQARQASLTS